MLAYICSVFPKVGSHHNAKQYKMIVIPPPNEVGGGVYWIHLVRPSVCPCVHPSVCRRHGFRSISQVCCGISISNFIYMLMVVIGRSLLIFSDITSITLLWFWISTPNFSGTVLMYMGKSLLIFSYVIFKMAAWRPYLIYRFLDSVGSMVSGV